MNNCWELLNSNLKVEQKTKNIRDCVLEMSTDYPDTLGGHKLIANWFLFRVLSIACAYVLTSAGVLEQMQSWACVWLVFVAASYIHLHRACTLFAGCVLASHMNL